MGEGLFSTRWRPGQVRVGLQGGTQLLPPVPWGRQDSQLDIGPLNDRTMEASHWSEPIGGCAGGAGGTRGIPEAGLPRPPLETGNRRLREAVEAGGGQSRDPNPALHSGARCARLSPPTLPQALPPDPAPGLLCWPRLPPTPDEDTDSHRQPRPPATFSGAASVACGTHGHPFQVPPHIPAPSPPAGASQPPPSTQTNSRHLLPRTHGDEGLGARPPPAPPIRPVPP